MSDHGPRDYVAVLRDLDAGGVEQEINETWDGLIHAVQERRKGGSITVKLEIKSEGGHVVVASKVTSKVPEPARDGTVFFTHKGRLVRENPAQMRLPVQEVPPPETAKEGR
jgi:hypothetical protein